VDVRLLLAACLLGSLGFAGGRAEAQTVIAGVTIPLGAPSLLSFEGAAAASYDPANSAAYGLKQLTDDSGQPLVFSTSNGVTGAAFVDGVGNIIAAYHPMEWYEQSEVNLATSAILGVPYWADPAYADSLTFIGLVEKAASFHAVPQSRIYVTGYSLGALLASFVASQTGLPGMSFGSLGIPGYQAGVPATNFINFVEGGDPFGQYGTDTAEKASAVVASPHMDHYGTIITLGTAADQASLAPVAAELAGHSYAEYMSGSSGITDADFNAVAAQLNAQMDTYHVIDRYMTDTVAVARVWNIDPAATW
jgi:hypothetical protein